MRQNGGVDWFLEPESRRAVGELRREVMSYLRRHGEPGSDLDGAELVFAEVVGNAVRHAGGPVWVTVSWSELNPTLTVRDLGQGFDATDLSVPVSARWVDEHDEGDDQLDVLVDPEAGGPVEADPEGLPESGLGLFMVANLAPHLEARARAGGGMSVSATLPVDRAPSMSHDPPRHTTGALPFLDEARPEGGFGKESFLRALVVQLARTVELQQGPDAAAAAVAQVGVDIGGQMEQEFRAAEAIVGRMTPEQLGRCYVRLKHAIDGGFHVVEADEHRIVLGNTRCPFGDVVRRAPSLCRMTSSVFGGIAARNSDHGVSVLLEERIAVGDPGCRVIVYLDEPPAEGRTLAHDYAMAAPAAAGTDGAEAPEAPPRPVR